MSLWFRQQYFHDSDYKTEFMHFLTDLHGLDLSRWDRAGFWDPDYIPFSYFEEGRLVSNVCVYSLPMVVDGDECRVAQICSVATARSHRRRGLNRELTEAARAWCRDHDHRFSFLFADEEATPYYDRLGFRPRPQSRYRYTPPAAPASASPGGLIPLDIDRVRDLDHLAAIAGSRVPVSSLLGHRSAGLLMFHALYSLRDCLFHLPALDLVVAAKATRGTLFIHDLIGSELPSFEQLRPYLQRDGISSFEFGFVPDLLGIEADAEQDDNGDGTHTDDGFPFGESPFRFPYTAHA